MNEIYKGFFGITNDPPETYLSNSKLKSLGVNVMYLLNMAYDNLDDSQMVDELVKKMARSHVRRGIQNDMFDDIVQPYDVMVMKALNEMSSDAERNKATFDTLHKAFVFLKTRIQEVYHECASESDN